MVPSHYKEFVRDAVMYVLVFSFVVPIIPFVVIEILQRLK